MVIASPLMDSVTTLIESQFQADLFFMKHFRGMMKDVDIGAGVEGVSCVSLVMLSSSFCFTGCILPDDWTYHGFSFVEMD